MQAIFTSNRDDAFSGSSVVHPDIKFEQACILYNIGCLFSYLGASDIRNTQEVEQLNILSYNT